MYNYEFILCLIRYSMYLYLVLFFLSLVNSIFEFHCCLKNKKLNIYIPKLEKIIFTIVLIPVYSVLYLLLLPEKFTNHTKR